MSGRYARGTTVSPEQTQAEITQTLMRYGAKDYMAGFRGGFAVIEFLLQTRHVRVTAPMPELKKFSTERKWEQAIRERWRAVLLILKGRLEAVASGIETFDHAFMADFVMPGGMTLAELMMPLLDDVLSGKHRLLPSPSKLEDAKAHQNP